MRKIAIIVSNQSRKKAADNGAGVGDETDPSAPIMTRQENQTVAVLIAEMTERSTRI